MVFDGGVVTTGPCFPSVIIGAWGEIGVKPAWIHVVMGGMEGTADGMLIGLATRDLLPPRPPFLGFGPIGPVGRDDW